MTYNITHENRTTFSPGIGRKDASNHQIISVGGRETAMPLMTILKVCVRGLKFPKGTGQSDTICFHRQSL